MTPTRQFSSHLTIALPLLLVAAFLILNISALQMHPDEELSYRATKGTLTDVLRWQIDLEDNQAPGWFITFWAWRTLVGDGEATSRMMSILLVMPAIALLSRMAITAFGTMAGVFTLLALIGNGLFFQYALDIRMYPLVMLVSTISTFLLWRWLARPSLRRAFFYGLSLAALLYTHYLLIFLIGTHVLYFLFRFRLRRSLVIQGLMAGMVSVVLFLPWLPFAIAQIQHLRKVETASGVARGSIGIGVSTLVTSPENIFKLVNFATNSLGWLYALLLVIGVFQFWRAACQHMGGQIRPTDAFSTYGLALLWCLGVPALTLLANTSAGVYAPRFVSYLTLGLALAIGAVIAHLPIYFFARVTVIGALVIANLLTFPDSLPVRIPYRDILRDVSARMSEDTSVLLVHAGEDDGFAQWQYDHYLSPSLRARLTTDPLVAQNTRRLWMLTRDWFNEDVQAVFKDLEPRFPVQQVYGQCDRAWCYLAQLLESPPLASPILFGEALEFRGADITFMEEVSDVFARLWWTVRAPLDHDYSFSIQFLNADGELVSQQDGALINYGAEIIQTSALLPGQIYVDQRTLARPSPTLSANGRWVLIVYDPATGERLTTSNGDSVLMLAELPPQ